MPELVSLSKYQITKQAEFDLKIIKQEFLFGCIACICTFDVQPS